MEQGTTDGAGRPPREWPRVLGLFGVVVVTSIFVHPGVVIGVPLALLLALRGLGNVVSAAVVGLVILIVAGGRDPLGDGLWYAERAWAVLLSGWFVATTLLVPSWRLTSRALGAVVGAAAVMAGVFAVRSGSWSALDASVSLLMQQEITATIEALRLLGSPDGLSSEMAELASSVASAQVAVFPALLGIESLAALGVAWWVWARLLGETNAALAPLRDFRFNDHLVWVLVFGLALLLTQSGASLTRVGSNAVVFMGALYALRGAAVFLFVTGGLSIFSTLLLVFLLAFVPVVLLGTAALIGVGDTWLDLRARAAEQAA